MKTTSACAAWRSTTRAPRGRRRLDGYNSGYVEGLEEFLGDLTRSLFDRGEGAILTLSERTQSGEKQVAKLDLEIKSLVKVVETWTSYPEHSGPWLERLQDADGGYPDDQDQETLKVILMVVRVWLEGEIRRRHEAGKHFRVRLWANPQTTSFFSAALTLVDQEPPGAPAPDTADDAGAGQDDAEDLDEPETEDDDDDDEENADKGAALRPLQHTLPRWKQPGLLHLPEGQMLLPVGAAREMYAYARGAVDVNAHAFAALSNAAKDLALSAGEQLQEAREECKRLRKSLRRSNEQLQAFQASAIQAALEARTADHQAAVQQETGERVAEVVERTIHRGADLAQMYFLAQNPSLLPLMPALKVLAENPQLAAALKTPAILAALEDPAFLAMLENPEQRAVLIYTIQATAAQRAA